MFRSFNFAAGALALAPGVFAGRPSTCHIVPSFDGPYLHPNASNLVTEWWYAQALEQSVNGSAPASVVVTFQGGPVSGTESANATGGPEWSIGLSGMFPNGTNFGYTLPASAASITTSDQEVNGVFIGAGNFTTNAALTGFTAQIAAPGITGTIVLQSNGAPHHYPCGPAPDPYFDAAAPAGVALNPTEELLFTQYGWVVTLTGGNASVELDVYGTPLRFTGNAYHDHDFLPTTLGQVFEMWYWAQAQVGPFDLTAALMQPLNSTLSVTTSFLWGAWDGILQDQCSGNASAADIVPWGTQTDANGLTVPQGFVINYTISDAGEYSFNLTGVVLNLDEPYYHRWSGFATGGQVGGEQHSGTALFEWLNPGLVLYNP